VAHEFRVRSVTFYTSKYWHRTPKDLENISAADDDTPFKEVPIQDDAQVSTFGDMALVTLRSDWSTSGRMFKQGSLLACTFDDLMAADLIKAQVLFEPTDTRSLEASTATKSFLVLKILEDVRSTLVTWKLDGKKFVEYASGGGLQVGEDVSVQGINRFSDQDDRVWLWRDGYLKQECLDIGDASSLETAETIKTKPGFFDSHGLTVDQHFAISKDGTKIPYFVQRRKDMKFDGSTPTLLDAYGGFEISLTPGYSAGVGIGWLERGGCKVIANIRGGGEYGPKWHQAALKEKRYKAYEDMEAVAADLIERGISSSPKLAVIGGSNGGLMVGNMITRPISSKLFGAAVCQVPLLDMKRFSHLLAGASWMAEYGDPDTDEWSFLRNHSPYQMLRHDRLGIEEDGEKCEADPEWTCPQVLFTTSTRDDRVHPGHARKMVKALKEDAPASKVPLCLYYENTEGGHGGAADNKQRAYMWALTYTFLADVLGLDEKEK
jgi:prolyl oligopeptidase